MQKQKVISPCGSVLVRLHLESCAQFETPSVQAGCWQTGVRITEMGARLRCFMDKRD